MDLFSLYATIGIKMDEFEQGIDKAQKKFKSFSENISGLSGKIDSAYKGAGDVLKPAVDGFKAVEGVGKKAGNVITTGLKGFIAAATAVGGFGTAAVKSGMAFDATMSKVSAISGATGEEFDALRGKALEMGAKTKFSASEAAEAMTYMGMAGWKAGDMISGIEGIMNLAAASGEDLASTSDIVTDALTAFGLQAGDSGHFADILAVASSNANTNVGLMGDTFKYVAPIAGALGYSVDDTALAIGLMANSGIKATQAGTALRSIFTRLSTDAGASSKSLGALGVLTEKLGVEFYNTDGSARDLNSVLMDSRAAWAGLSEEQQISYAKTIAGQEAMSGWLALMNAAPADVDKLTASLNDCNGAAEKMAATMVDNLQGDITLLKSAFESLQIAISDSLTPTLREFAQFGQKAMASLLEGFQGSGVSGFMSALSGIVTDGVKMLSEKAPAFAEVSVQFIGALGEGLINAAPQALDATGQVIDTIITGLSSFLSEHSADMVEIGRNVIDMVSSGFKDAVDVVTAHIGEFIPLIADGFATYHETLFTIGLDILGAIGKGIVENKDEIQSIASKTIENMVTSLRDNAPMIIAGGLALLEALVGAIEENLPLILKTGGEIIGQLIEGISKASPGVQAIIATAVLPHILKIIDTVGRIGGAVSSVASVVGGSINTVIGIGGKLMGGISKLFGLIAANPVVAVIAGIIAAVVLLYTKCEWFRDAVHAVIDAVTGFFKGAWEAIKAVWEGAGKFFGSIVDGIKSAFNGIGEFLGNLFKGAWEAVKGAWDAAKDFFGDLWNGIKEKASEAASNIRDKLKEAWDGIKSAWDTAKTFFGDLWSSIKEKGGEAADKVKSAFEKAWSGIKSVWEGAKGFFSGVWDNIKGVFSNAGEHFKSIGSNIMNGLVNGIKEKFTAVKNAVGNVVNGIKNVFTGKSGFDEHSPSKWSNKVFRYLLEGGVDGLDAGAANLLREVEAITEKVKSGMEFGVAPIGLSADTEMSGGGMRGKSSLKQNSSGSLTVNIYSPEKTDAVQAAREWQKTSQRMALGLV